ncbi:MAG TPA: hypothetical protein PLJ50_14480, partial [Candidatus Latescibacteria bacterium]|nr:hypothetical protein [Candidatus Latescibacterota bacterium]
PPSHSYCFAGPSLRYTHCAGTCVDIPRRLSAVSPVGTILHPWLRAMAWAMASGSAGYGAFRNELCRG